MLLFKKQILQIAAAWLLRFEGYITDWELGIMPLPWFLAAKITCFWFLSLYRGEWRYLSVHDLVQMAKASLTGSAS